MNKTVTVTIPVEVLLAIFGAELVAYFITRALHHVPPMVLVFATISLFEILFIFYIYPRFFAASDDVESDEV